MVRSQPNTPLVHAVRTFHYPFPFHHSQASPRTLRQDRHGRTDRHHGTAELIYTVHVCAFKFSQSVTMSSACCMDVINGGSLRVRNSNCVGSGPYDYCKAKEVRACPSVMSPETKRLLPPNTETVQTKPFPIRGR